jgi:hypothetical protein
MESRIGIYVRSKDEENIIEFMDHYYDLGFDIILFYDDKSSPSISEIIEKENNPKHINKYRIIRNEVHNIDNLNNNEYFKINILPIIQEIMDYCFYIDMDEYLKSNESISEIINYYLPFDSLKINWLFFGNNDIIKSDLLDKLKTTFLKSSIKLNNHVKQIVKVEKIIGSDNPHYFLLKGNSIVKNILNEITINDHKEDKLVQYSFKDVKIYLAHYIVQGTYNFVKRRFCRKTSNTECFKNENILLFFNDNLDNICKFIYDENIENIVYMSSYEKNVVRCVLNFYKLHNCNEEFNYDLV